MVFSEIVFFKTEEDKIAFAKNINANRETLLTKEEPKKRIPTNPLGE
jgi:hypothetical protein|tara:strand:+ start:3162 stop:3302 length:141 start_codon:yes stop_codon:yes gene_type:complete